MIAYKQLFTFTQPSTAANISFFIGFLNGLDDNHDSRVIACEKVVLVIEEDLLWI
jgi:hypothetical protein